MHLRRTIRWAIDSLVRVLGPEGARSEYVIITPPFLRSQRVLNRRTRTLKRYEVRDRVDVSVLYQTFLDEQYRISRLARCGSIRSRYEHILAAGCVPLILDCGANIGLSAAYFAEQFPEARIVAIEPEPGNAALARKNCPDVELIQAAVSSEAGRGSVHDTGDGNWAFRVQPDASGAVEFVSIDELLNRHPDCEPFLIKIDIEGFEGDLFSKNTKWVDRFFVLIVELHDWMLPMQGTSASFLKTMALRERDFVYLGENVFSIAYDV